MAKTAANHAAPLKTTPFPFTARGNGLFIRLPFFTNDVDSHFSGLFRKAEGDNFTFHQPKDQVAHPRDKEGLLHVYNKVLPPLAQKVFEQLQEIIPMFDDFKLEKVLDTWTKDKESSTPDQEISLENGNVQQMGLRLQLLGFQRAGAHTFDLSKDLVFSMEYSSYTVGPDKNTRWAEKLYLHPWTNQELEEIAQQWVEQAIEDITQQVQGLS